jgi:DNA-binding MarR family transcriptional regulator
LINNENIDINSLDTEKLYKAFEVLNKNMEIIYHFALNYNEYMNSRHPYTKDEALTTLEAHLLTDICDYPNSTVTSLSNSWNRSVSATSQTVRTLIKKGLVTRKNSKTNAKVFFLIPTEKGIKTSDAHKRYDTLDIIKTIKSLRHTLTIDEIEIFFKGMEVYTSLLNKTK